MNTAKTSSAPVVPDLRKVAETTPEQEEFLIYDIEGDLSPDAVLKVFKGFDVPYKFKVLNGRRFIVVLRKTNPNNAAYSNMKFPKATRVEVHTAEYISDYYQYLGVAKTEEKEEDIVLPDENLYLTEYTVLNQGTNEEEYKKAMTNLGLECSPYNKAFHARVFHLTCTMPFRGYGVVALPSVTQDRALLESAAVFGGPFQCQYNLTPITNM